MKTLKRSVAVLLSILMLISVFSVTAMTAFAQGNTYTVAGSSADIFGTTWDNANKANDMTDDNGDGIFEKVYTGVPAGNYEFKIVENYNWDTSYGNNGSNVPFSVESDNTTVTITFDSSSKAISIKGASSGIAAPGANHTYTVAGVSKLCGSDWTPDDTNNDMTDSNGDGVFEKVYTNVAAGTYEFKVTQDHSWTTSYGDNGNNVSFNVDNNGSTVTITFDSNTATVSYNVATSGNTPVTPNPTDGELKNKFVAIIYCEKAGTDDASRNTEVEFNADGTLAYNFIGDSYVFVRNFDTGVQYCTNGWSDFANPVTLVNEANLTSTFDKMYVPAGEHTLYLADNGDDTYTLSYDTGAITPPSTPSTPTTEPNESTPSGGNLKNKFVAIIYCEQAGTDDASRNTEVAFNPDGTLTYNFIGDSYVFVRNYDTGVQYCTDGWTNFANPVTLVNEAVTTAFDKMYVPAGEHTLYLADNGNDTYTLGYDTGSDQPASSDPANTEPSESTAPTTPSVPGVQASKAVEFDADTATAEYITISLSLQVDDKLVNGEGSLKYDNTVLQLESFELLNVTGKMENTELNNEVLFNFTDPQNPADFTTAKDIIVVKFKVLKTAKTSVTLSVIELNATKDGKDVPIVTDGNIVNLFKLDVKVDVTAPTEPSTPGTEPTTPTEPSVPTEPTNPTDPSPAPAISVKKKLNAGETTTVSVKNAGDNKVTYKSTNDKVATVNKNTGKITALAKGKTTIEVKIGDVTLTKKVKVKNNPVLKNNGNKVKNNQTITVKKGKTLTLNVVGKAAKIKNKVTTSKKNIGKITSKAKQAKVTFKAKKVGTTVLTIKINNVKTYKVKVKVK